MASEKWHRPRKRQQIDDRYIPTRGSALELKLQQAKLASLFDKEPTQYTDALCRTVFSSDYEMFKPHTLWGPSYKQVQQASLLNFSMPSSSMPPQPTKVLYSLKNTDNLYVTYLIDDFYINPLCWGSKKVYMGVEHNLYSYDPATTQLDSIPSELAIDSYITSICHSNGVLIYASSQNELVFLDEANQKKLRVKIGSSVGKNYATRVVPDAMQQGFYMISRSYQDFSTLKHYDLRSGTFTFNLDFVENKPIGLAFDKDTQALAVSIGSCIDLWDIRSLKEQPQLEFKGHLSPSKALAFCPDKRGILASGGGTDDKSIKIWSTLNGAIQKETVAGNQITNLHWLNKKRLFATEGFFSNRVSCWTESEFTLKRDLESHSFKHRILYSAQNPANPSQVVAAAPGDKISFWSVNKKTATKDSTQFCSGLSSLR